MPFRQNLGILIQENEVLKSQKALQALRISITKAVKQTINVINDLHHSLQTTDTAEAKLDILCKILTYNALLDSNIQEKKKEFYDLKKQYNYN